jgi:hypothetical protein
MKARSLLFAFLLATSITASAQTSATSSLINQQLDKQADLQLKGSLPEVMQQITQQTAVPVEATQEVWDLLPWGKETSVTARIGSQTLREALTTITTRLGLTFVLKDQSIELQPMPALRRLGRKSTLAEVEGLNLLASTPLQLGTDKTDLKTLAELIDQKLLAAKTTGYAVENRTGTSPNPIAPNTPLSIPRNATLLDALEALPVQTAATWYPWGKTIVILPKQDQIRRQLQTEISLRHDGTDVAQVLAELSVRAGIPFQYEPGTFQELAPQSRAIRLVLNCSVQRALDEIVGLTGLAYMIKDDNVYIWNTASTAAAANKPRDRTIAMFQTETGMQVLVTEASCPPDIREYIEWQKNKQYDAMRKMMAEQGFKPTQPATRPAATPAPATTPKPAAPAEPPGKDL